MAGMMFSLDAKVSSSSVTSTVLQVAAAANRRLVIREVWVGGLGNVPGSSSAEVYLAVQSSAGSGGTALTPGAVNFNASTNGSYIFNS